MTTPVPLPQFTVQQYMEEAGATPDTVSGDPVTSIPLPILAKFTPSQHEVEVSGSSFPFTVYIDTLTARVDTDGYLKGINSEPVWYDDNGTIYPVPQLSSANQPVHPVYTGTDEPGYWIDDFGNRVDNPPGVPVWGARLVSNSSLLALADPLTYRVDYSAGAVPIASLRFAAPTTDVIVNLSTVPRLEL